MDPIAESMKFIEDAEAVYAEANALYVRSINNNNPTLSIFAKHALAVASESLNAAKKMLLSACKLDDARKACNKY